MAVYQYKCEQCSDEFEVKRGMNEQETETKCPRCGSTNTRRIYASFNQGGCCGTASPEGYRAPRHFG